MLQLCRPFASIPLSFCLFAPPAIAAHVVTPLCAQEPWKAQNVTGFTSNFKTFPTLFGEGLRMEKKANLGQKRSKGEAGWSTSSNCSVKKLQVVKGPIKLRQLLFHVSFFQHLPFPSKCYIFFVIPLIGLWVQAVIEQKQIMLFLENSQLKSCHKYTQQVDACDSCFSTFPVWNLSEKSSDLVIPMHWYYQIGWFFIMVYQVFPF